MPSTARPKARDLTPSERRLVEELLRAELEGAEELRQQARSVRVYPSCRCGCGSIGFEHDNGLRPGPDGLEGLNQRINWMVRDAEGQEVGGLILLVKAGLLDDLEVYSFGPEPSLLPEPEFTYKLPGD